MRARVPAKIMLFALVTGTGLAFFLIYLLRLYWGFELNPLLKGAVAGALIGGIIVFAVKGSRSANKNE